VSVFEEVKRKEKGKKKVKLILIEEAF